MKEKIHIEHLKNGDVAVKLQQETIGRLLRTSEEKGYDCILEFTSTKPIEETYVGSLMHGAYLIKHHYEQTFDKKLTF